MDSNKPEIERGSGNRVSSIVDGAAGENRISGPLGIWPWPILNFILSNNRSRLVITEVNRDNDGRIESIEEFRI